MRKEWRKKRLRTIAVMSELKVFDKHIYAWNSNLDYGNRTDIPGVIHRDSMILNR